MYFFSVCSAIDEIGDQTDRERERKEMNLSGESEFESNPSLSISLLVFLSSVIYFMVIIVSIASIESEYLGTGSTWLSVKDRTRVLDLLSECHCLLLPLVAVRLFFLFICLRCSHNRLST